MIERLKNLWELSQYVPKEKEGEVELTREVPKIKKKSAIIIMPERSQLEESIYDEGGTIE